MTTNIRWWVNATTVRRVLIRRHLENGQIAVSRWIEGKLGSGAWKTAQTRVDPADLFPLRGPAVTEYRRRKNLSRSRDDARCLITRDLETAPPS